MLVLTITTPSLPCVIQPPLVFMHKCPIPTISSISLPKAQDSPFSTNLAPLRLYLGSPCTHLLAVNTPVVRLDDDEALAGDVQAGALDLLDVGGVLVGGDNLLHFGGRDGEAGAGRPDAVAGVVEDSGAVDVAGADEAVGG